MLRAPETEVLRKMGKKDSFTFSTDEILGIHNKNGGFGEFVYSQDIFSVTGSEGNGE